MTILSFALQVWAWLSMYLDKCFKWHFYSSRRTTVPNVLSFDLIILTFQMTLLLLKKNNCAKLFWNPCINVQVMARTNSGRHKQAQQHRHAGTLKIHQTEVVTTMFRSPPAGSTKMILVHRVSFRSFVLCYHSSSILRVHICSQL